VGIKKSKAKKQTKKNKSEFGRALQGRGEGEVIPSEESCGAVSNVAVSRELRERNGEVRSCWSEPQSAGAGREQVELGESGWKVL
jgi:hypothetical protein